MKILVNGEPRDSGAATLDALWRAETADLDLPGPQGFAIALNGAVVRQRDWAATALSEGDRVEIVRAMQGG
ncbi:sulfur carrier protein ThiS [Methylobacterium terricola]|uniref:Sulfur carrier protein ThiS n=1 Tax=Methylobacterium terricola TaxID=2583531 RepID=A0A5C4LC28_9HYPH|nr:sulfur carrier protein ThiS [Methylobacterium terricola]TNC10431.1 sulfur carrier protein ThiS [Methylobacterium terricola]